MNGSPQNPKKNPRYFWSNLVGKGDVSDQWRVKRHGRLPNQCCRGLRLHRNISDRTGLLLLVRIPVDTCHMFTLVVGVAVAAISSSSKNIAVVAATVAAASAVETRYSRNSHLRPTKSRYYNDLFSAPFRASCYNPIG